MNLNRCRTSAQYLFASAGIAIALLAVAATPSNAVPVIFNASETAKPGDIIYAQGAWGAGATINYELITGSTTPSFSASTPLTVTTEGSTSQTSAPGEACIAAKVPATAAAGLYAIWVTDGSGTSSGVQYMNRAHGVQLECPAIAPGWQFRIFGRNLLESGATASVTFADQASPYTAYTGTVTTSGSDGNVLWVTAPTTLTVNHYYTVTVNNGYAGASGNAAVEPDNVSQTGVLVQWPQETSTPSTTIASGSFSWSLNVPWQADYLTLSSHVYNAKTTYGATGNGTTNDAPAIQAAINAASNAGGGTVYIPSGTYRLDFYSGGNSTNHGILWLPSKVVLIGDGPGHSILKFGYEAAPSGVYNCAINRPGSATTGLINLELDNMETANPGVWHIRPTDGYGNEFFVQDCTINAATAQAVGMTGGQYGLVANSAINVTNLSESHSCFNGEANLTLYKNNYTYNVGRSWSGGIHDLIVDSNTITRSATSPSQSGYEAGFADWWGDHVVFVSNLFQVGNTNTDIEYNDGEQILTEQDGGGYRATGSVTSATSTTLTDSSANYGSGTANCFSIGSIGAPWANANSYMVAIVSGPGTGQWRYITSNTATTVTLGSPWAVVPTAGSHYTIVNWSANEWLVKNNTFNNNHLGLLYYSSSTNCVTIGNTFTNDDGILWIAYQNIGGGGSTANVFHVQWAHQAYNNMIGVSGTPTYTWPSVFTIMQDIVDPSATVFGTGILGMEMRGNSLTAHSTNLEGGEGFLGEQYENMLVDEDNWPRYAPVDTSNIGILGTIFQNNKAYNQVASYTNPNTNSTMPNGAYWVGTGTYATTIDDPYNSNVGAEIYDQTGGIPGSGLLAAYPTSGAGIDYQFEYGALSGPAPISVGTDSAASAGAYVGGLNGTTDAVTVSNVDGDQGGYHVLTFTYATNGATADTLYVNSNLVGDYSIPSTGAWTGTAAWKTVSVPVLLNPGTSNTVEVYRGPTDGAINLDKFNVQGYAATKYEFENGTLLGGGQIAVGTDSYASNGEYVGGLNGTGNAVSYANVNGNLGGPHNLQITYATPSAAHDSLYVNGTLITDISFPATSGWGGSASAWQTITVPVSINLNAGTTNTIEVYRNSTDTSINLDKFTIY